MQVHVLRSAERLYHSAASWIAAEIAVAVSNRGKCSIALAGGNTPKNIYRLLSQPPFSEDIPWQQVYFFWGDERMVPFDDEQNNAKMAIDNLLEHVPVKKENIFRIPSELEPAEAEKQYDHVLHQHFSDDDDEFSFDLVLLGMGDDGHTLSLFPNEAVLEEKQRWVAAYYVEHLQQYRLTLLPALVNKSRRITFIISGESKAAAFKAVMSPVKNAKQFPAQLIQPLNGELHWFIDDAAATGIAAGATDVTDLH
jgi:6-phosphogluconolactonase